MAIKAIREEGKMRKYQDPAFLKMREEGKSYTEIAEAFGWRPATVMGWVRLAIRDGLIKPLQHRWSEQDCATLKTMYLGGENVQTIAKAIGVSDAAISGQVIRMGLKRPGVVRLWTPDRVSELRRLKAKGFSDDNAAKEMGVSKKSLIEARRKHDIGSVFDQSVWSEAQTQRLKTMWAEGLNPAEIARRLGMTRMKVQSKAARMGLPMNRGTPIIRKPAERSYDTVVAAARARKGMTMKPRPTLGPKEVPDVIPEGARPWLTRLSGECAYPYGPRGNVHSCCKPVWHTGVYCESHTALCMDERKAA